MAVTVSQQPEGYTPVYNEQVFVALSNQTAQPNFEYTVKVSDMITGVTKTFPVAKRPDDYLVWDAGEFARSYFDPDHHYIPMNVYGWQQATGIRKIRVNIGETYGAGTPVYTAGSNIDYIVWNGCLNFKDFPNYDPDDFVYRSDTITNLVYLTQRFNDVTYPGRSNYFYALTAEAGDILNIQIETFDSAGVLIDTSTIDNPYEALTAYASKYLCIDVGHKGLSNIDAGQVTGAYPIITDDVASYTVVVNCITGGPPAGNADTVRTYTVGCEPKFDVYTVHFLGMNGGFETINFSKRAEKENQVTKSTFRRDPHVFSAGTYTYSSATPQEYVLAVMEKETLKLSTDWLSQDQADLYKQIIKSGYAYLDTGDDEDFLALKVVTSSLRPHIRQNEKLYQLVIDFELAYVNTAQT